MEGVVGSNNEATGSDSDMDDRVPVGDGPEHRREHALHALAQMQLLTIADPFPTGHGAPETCLVPPCRAPLAALSGAMAPLHRSPPVTPSNGADRRCVLGKHAATGTCEEMQNPKLLKSLKNLT